MKKKYKDAVQELHEKIMKLKIWIILLSWIDILTMNNDIETIISENISLKKVLQTTKYQNEKL